MSRNSVRIWLSLSVLVALGIAPFLAQGNQLDQQLLDQNRAAIAAMTPSERDRLDRNFQAYQLMDDAKVASLETFHNKMEQDRVQGDGELNSALGEYHEWLGTIQPFQRDQLKQVTDPKKRIALIHQIMEESRDRDANRFMKQAYQDSSDPIWQWWKSRLRMVPVLNDVDLAALMNGLQDIEKAKLSLADQTELNSTQGVEKYLLLLNKIRKNTNTRAPDNERRRSMVLPQFQKAFTELGRTFDQYVEDSKARDYMSREEEDENIPPYSMRIQATLIKSLIVHAELQNKSGEMISAEELKKLFSFLPEAKQQEMLQLDAIDFYRDLRKLTEASIDGLQVIQPFVSEEFYDSLKEKSRRSFGSPGREGRFRNDDNDRPGFRGSRNPDGRSDREGRPFEGGRPSGRSSGPFPRNGEFEGPGRSRSQPLAPKEETQNQ